MSTPGRASAFPLRRQPWEAMRSRFEASIDLAFSYHREILTPEMWRALEHYLFVSSRRGDLLFKHIMDHRLIMYYFISCNCLLKLEHILPSPSTQWVSKQNCNLLPTFPLMKHKVSIEGSVAIGPEPDSLRVRWRRRPSSHSIRWDELDVFEIEAVSIDGES